MKSKIKIVVLVLITALSLNVLEITKSKSVAADEKASQQRNIVFEQDDFKFYLDEIQQTAILRNVYENNSELEECIIPEEVVKDDKRYKVIAFGNFKFESDGSICGDPTGGIPQFDFYFYKKLKRIILPENLETLRVYITGIKKDSSLEEFYIPSTAREVEWGYLIDGFDKIAISSDNPWFCREGNMIVNKDHSTLLYVNRDFLTESTIFIVPDGIKTIGEHAMDLPRGGNLSEVILPEGLVEIEGPFLRNASSLQKIVFPSSVRRIDYGGLIFTPKVTEVRLPLKLEYLGYYFKSDDFDELVENNEGFVEIFMIPMGVNLDEEHSNRQEILFNNESQIVVYTAGAENVKEYVDLLIGRTSKYGFSPQVARATIKNIQAPSKPLHAEPNSEINMNEKFKAPLVFYRNSSGEEEISMEEVQADGVLSTVELSLDYKLIGNTSSQTMISDKGILKIGEDELAESITIQATYYLNQDVNAEIQIILDGKIDESNPDSDTSGGSQPSSGSGKTDRTEPGWNKKEDTIFYIDENGNKVKGFYDIEDETYFFDDSGAMMQNSWITVQDKRYYAQGGGAIVKGWLKVENDQYYVSENDGHMITDWVKVQGNWYFFDPANGKMWRNHWTPDDKENWYYVDADGKMMRHSWIPSHSGYWYYVGDDGRMIVNTTIDGCNINSLGIYKSLSYTD